MIPLVDVGDFDSTGTLAPTLVLSDDVSAPVVELGDASAEITELLGTLFGAISRQPGVADAVLRLLVAEGRRYFETRDGQAIGGKIATAPAFQGIVALLDNINVRFDGALSPGDYLESLLTHRSSSSLDELFARYELKEAERVSLAR